MENEVASRYGLALYSLALETDKVSDYQKEVKEIMRALKENADFIMVLSSSFLPIEERKKMLETALKGVSEPIISFIEIIMDNHRTNELFEILYSFNSYCNNYRGIIEGYLYSSIRLDESTIQKIEAKISQKENNKVELRNIVDPSLIGGVKVVVHDRIYDGSIKHHLEMMEKDLLIKEGK
ncbi:MAG: F0F1 ATP synthase subunit delta [Bacilli bacterium]|nr:F0F1 ATP synthase subunit delta [Bacilli bacterium]